MKSKKLAVAILMISIVMIISGTVCAFVVSLKADREATQARMLVVNDEFESFNKSVTSFEEAREALNRIENRIKILEKDEVNIEYIKYLYDGIKKKCK